MKVEETIAEPEEIGARSFRFAARIVLLCQTLDQSPCVSRTLANQLLRSGTSIGTNIEEAKGGQSNADFVAKMYIACKEAREIVSEQKLSGLTDESNQLVAILTTIVKRAKKPKTKKKPK